MSGEADKVELVFTKFVSLITSTPTIQTLLPLTPTGELCDVDGNCVDAAEDEIFKLTTQVSWAVDVGWLKPTWRGLNSRFLSGLCTPQLPTLLHGF